MPATPNIPEYPVHGLMPKQDTQASSFLKKYPEYDGRGTVVAILDTGIDPGAPGLKVTSDGKPKIIDIVDCTGGGDVDTTKVVKPETIKRDGVDCTSIKGLSGKDLIIDPSWSCPSEEFRVGLKPCSDVFPEDQGLSARLQKDRRRKFEIEHARLMAEAQNAMGSFDKEHPTLIDETLICQRADLEARVDQLKDLASSYSDPGKVFDCVVFFDGSDWRAVIDVDGSGDLRGQPCLADYKKEHQFHTFGEEDLLNFSVNIYQDGDLLSIVTVSGSHGTHVAGITAANFPEEPALNGVAPGAQLVSLRIGDTRLDGMETGAGLTRAASYLATHSINLANMSFGESSSLPTGGHFVDLLSNEAITKSGCIFVTSAGNEGPCHGTVGAPGGMSDDFISVGAYVKHSQMIAEYAMRQSVEEKPYTWSSRGPCVDGYRGVDIYAPGSAITSVPVYSLNKLYRMNGTSMASPNACGCLALLVSGLKAKNMKVTPYRVKNAMVQTAKDVDDPMQVGFIQVEKAWEYLENVKDRDDRDILFKVDVIGVNRRYRGIYLREQDETTRPQYLKAMIQPTYMKDHDNEKDKDYMYNRHKSQHEDHVPLIATESQIQATEYVPIVQPTYMKDLDNEKDKDYMYNRHKSQYEARVALIATESWIQAPEYVYLNSSGEFFEIKVDPTALSENGFHYGEVRGYDTTAPDVGPLFRIPVTVIKPMSPRNGSIRFKASEYGPGDIIRQFVHVPEGSTYCQLTLRAKAQQQQQSGPAMFFLDMLQVIPHKSRKYENASRFNLGSGSYSDPNSEEQVVIKRFSVRGGLTMEFCLAQLWSGLGQHTVDLQLEFHGIQAIGAPLASQGALRLNPDVTRLELTAPLRVEENVPVSIKFEQVRRYLRPSNATISPMHADRNTLPNTEVLFGLVLTYNLKVDARTTITPSLPAAQNRLYENFLASVIGIVYDTHRKVLGVFDVFEHKIDLARGGEYTIMVQIMTEKEDVLQKLKTMVCEVDLKVNAVNAKVCSSLSGLYDESVKSDWKPQTLERKRLAVCYIAPPDKLPEEAEAGDALVGSLELTKEKIAREPHKVIYNVPPRPSTNKKEPASPEPKDEQVIKDLQDAVLDLQLTHLRKLSVESDSYKALLSKIKNEDGDNVKCIEHEINDLWKASKDKNIEDNAHHLSLTKEEGEAIICLADKMIETVDQRALLEFNGRNSNAATEGPEQKQKRKEMEKHEKTLKSALKHKIVAQLASHVPLEDTFKVLEAYMGENAFKDDPVWVLIRVQRERDAGRYGSALKLIRQYLGEVRFLSDTSGHVARAWSLCRQIYDDLGWAFWAKLDDRQALLRKPPGGLVPF